MLPGRRPGDGSGGQADDRAGVRRLVVAFVCRVGILVAGPGVHPVQELQGRQGYREEISLADVALQLRQPFGRQLVLYPFRHHLETEAMAQLDGGVDDGGCLLAVQRIDDE